LAGVVRGRLARQKGQELMKGYGMHRALCGNVRRALVNKLFGLDYVIGLTKDLNATTID